MNKDIIGNIFDFISETNLTEEFFYENMGEYPVVSGQTEKNGIVAYISSFVQDYPCVTFTTYGVGAGKLYYRNGKYTIGRNCLGLKTTEKYKKYIDLEWFAYKYQNLFYRKKIGDISGQRSLNKTLLENVEINFPKKTVQTQQFQHYKKAQKITDNINILIKKLNDLLNSNFNIVKFSYEENIETLFKIKGGNSGLTEEFVYHNQPTIDEEKIPIISGATLKKNFLGYISKDARPKNRKLKVFNGPFIYVIRKGLAGKMMYVENGKFATNDDVYVLIPKRGHENDVNLRWFAYQYQELFFNLITSKSDNATFNKKYAEKQKVKFPDKETIQDGIADKLKRIDNLINSLERLKEKIENLMHYEIV